MIVRILLGNNYINIIKLRILHLNLLFAYPYLLLNYSNYLVRIINRELKLVS